MLFKKAFALLPVITMTLSIFAVEEVRPRRDESPRDAALSDDITARFRSDPLFQGMNISIDLYKGLAIVHGGAPNQEMIDVVNGKLRDTRGVLVVYNYMSSPETAANAEESIAVTYDNFDRMRSVGMGDNAFMLAARVRERLRADGQLNAADISVDTYRGLVVLHGSADNEALVKRATDIARTTTGADAVLNYMTPEFAPDLTTATRFEAPIVVRDVFVEPESIPVRVETHECR